MSPKSPRQPDRAPERTDPPEPEPEVSQFRVMPSRFVVIRLAASVTGLSEKAISCKIGDGVWREGYEYRHGPDGRIYIDLEGYVRWVLGIR